MKVTTLKIGLGGVVLVSLALGLIALLLTVTHSHQVELTIPPTVTENPTLAKIEPDLLRIIGLEEHQQGIAWRQAEKDYIFDEKGRILVTIAFDKTRTTVSRAEPVQYQETGQLVAGYGGKVDRGIPLTNEIVAFVPLNRITGLAAEESVVRVYAEKRLLLDPIIVATVTATLSPVSPEATPDSLTPERGSEK